MTRVSSGQVPLAVLSTEIDLAARQRAELLRVLCERHDPQIASECADLDDRLAGLWELQRLVRARLRYGEPHEIKRRARVEERILRSA
jgi:hypothetical protein